MANVKDRVETDVRFGTDGLGVTIQALFDGMESLVQSKTVVGEPFEAGGALIIPLIEISAGMASGAFIKKDKNNGAGAMNAKMSPVALLIVQDGRTKLVSVRDQDIFTRLLDLIPEAIDKVKKGAVSAEARKQAEQLAGADTSEIEVITPEKAGA